MTNLCCTSILNPTKYKGVSSVTQFDLISTPAFTTPLFPRIMNSQQYCKLMNLGSVFAYNEFYIKADSICYEQVFKCFMNGTMVIYPASTCKGTPTVYNLNETVSDFYHQYTSNFQAQAVVIEGAAAKIGYTQIAPSNLLSYSNLEPSEIIATSLLSLLLILEVLSLGYYVYRYKSSGKKSLFLMILGHFCWLLSVCLIMAFNNSRAAKDSGLYAGWAIFYALGQLFAALFSANSITTIWNFTRTKKYILYTIVFVVHFTMMAGYYLIWTMYRDLTVVSQYDSNLEVWTTIVYDVWVIIYFMFNLVPIFATIVQYSPTAATDWYRETKLAFKRDFSILVIFVSQFFIGCGFLVVEIMQGTSYVGNDRNALSLKSYSIFFVIVHSFMNLLIVARVTIGVSKAIQNNNQVWPSIQRIELLEGE